VLPGIPDILEEYLKELASELESVVDSDERQEVLQETLYRARQAVEEYETAEHEFSEFEEDEVAPRD
jgi:ferritin-like metal-binding protein YciE